MKNYHLSSLFSIKALYFTLFLTVFQSNSFAQSEADQILEKDANTSYTFLEYNDALPLYLKLLEKYPENFLYNYRSGVCYLKSNIQTINGIPYFEKALDIKSLTDGATSEFYFYVGSAYQISNQFDKAIENYRLSKTFPDANDSIVDVSLQQCEVGKAAIEKPGRGRIYNLGTGVNSIYPDYSPVVLKNKSQLFFASSRKGTTGGKKTSSGGYFEDIYTVDNSTLKDTSINLPTFTSDAKKLGTHINTSAIDKPITTTPDGSKLILFKKGNITESIIYGDKYGTPTKFKNAPFSKKNVGSNFTFSKNGQTIYFSDSRNGGIGGMDIYKSQLQPDGTWGEAINLGPTINTPEDEVSPYYDKDKQTLYFSSNGYGTMGGFDVFKAKWADEHWKDPRNLGYPINSGADEVGFSYDSKTNVGYYSTMRADGVGNSDIYMVRFIKPLKVIATATFSDTLKAKELKIQVKNLSRNKRSSLTLNNQDSIKYKSSSIYQLLVPHYDSTSVVDTLIFETPETIGDARFYQEFNYEALRNHKGLLIGYKTTIYNVFFDVEGEIVKRGLRNRPFMMERYPACNTNDPKFFYYKDKNITKDEEYAFFAKTLEPQFEDFNIYQQINYVDTSHFVTDSIYLADSLNRTIFRDSPPIDTIFKTILFDFVSDSLPPNFKQDIKEVITYLKQHSDVSVEVIGHTDSKGNLPSNLKWSIKRAEKAQQVLIDSGIDPKRITTTGKGKLDPVAENTNKDGTDNPEGRKLNRRVEFYMTTE